MSKPYNLYYRVARWQQFLDQHHEYDEYLDKPKPLTQRDLQLALKDYRHSLKLTQKEFAEYYGYETPTAVSLWESGQRDMPTIIAVDVFNYLVGAV